MSTSAQLLVVIVSSHPIEDLLNTFVKSINVLDQLLQLLLLM
jgi:hypothetical protein